MSLGEHFICVTCTRVSGPWPILVASRLSERAFFIYASTMDLVKNRNVATPLMFESPLWRLMLYFSNCFWSTLSIVRCGVHLKIKLFFVTIVGT
jgi:hypothetical protein